MGLIHPTNLDDWRAWQRGTDPIARLRAVRSGGPSEAPPTRATLVAAVDRPRHLVVVESANPSSRAALLAVLDHLPDAGLLVPTSLDPALLGAAGTSTEVDLGGGSPRLAEVDTVSAAGHYTGLGGAAYDWSRRRGARFVTVQHGLLTPYAPPLAPGTTLLAWSAADADFWRSGRDDVTTHVVGSQLLREAAARPAEVHPDDRPVFLGQLHGAELSRWGMARTAGGFCRATHAIYRPHPSERDRLSRWQHALWRRRGITVEDPGTPLTSIDRPVVGMFSTGVLEAAARGIPSWVTHVAPPAWLKEFWERYGLSRWGDDPTPAPSLPPVEPAAAIAAHLVGGAP
ncbi:hypothetical protein [Janibacter massiliensis]|uniref:hypothetical protein n=1 Tax=Janibacter massiliensis TaxID=2058291 RepID=UPI000D104207|nr:hypothetical protein [Janibacter massiliensis]